MRCPKCGARFQVHPDGRVADAAAPRAPAVPKPGGRPAPPKPAAGALADLPAPKGSFPKPAAGGVDLPAPVGRKIAPPVPEVDLPAPVKKRPPAPPRPAAPKASRPNASPNTPPKPPAPRAKPAPPPPGDLDLDLPAPRSKAASPDLDLDLPAPVAKKRPIAPPVAPAKPEELDLDLPAPRAPKPPAPPKPPAADLDLDLPAPRPLATRRSAAAKQPEAPSRGSDDLDLDLPAPRNKAAPADLDLDLPAPLGGKSAPFANRPAPDGGADLPAPRGAAPRSALADEGTPFDDLDLPARAGDRAELPAPKASADLPGLKTDFGGVDLPQAKAKRKSVIDEAEEVFGDLDLPMPKAASSQGGFGDIDLPVPKAQSDLPVPKDDAFGDLELPTPRSDPGGAAFEDLDLPTPREVADLPQVADGTDLPQVAEHADLPVAAEASDLPIAMQDGFDDLALPEPRAQFSAPPPPELDEGADDAAMRDAAGRTGVGGVGFGELDLGDGGDADDMEFADIPEEGESAAGRDSLPPPRVAARKAKAKAEPGTKKKGRAILYVAVALVVLLAAGGALALTPYGVFGINLIDQFLPGAGDPAQVRAAINSAEEQAASDRWVDVRESLVTLGRARAQAGLNAEMLSHSLAHEGLYQVRFGDGFGSTERAARIAQRLAERDMDGPEVALGLAGNHLRLGNLAGARGAIAQARQHAGTDPYVDLILGEVELAAGNPDEAAAAFTAAAESGGSARALWGVARASLAGDDTGAQVAAVEAVLAESPQHGDAMAARAELHYAASEVDEAYTLARQAAGLEPVGDETLRSAPGARATALTLVGRIDEERGRSSAALSAYDAALNAVDSHVPAFLGAGRVLLADRPGDAMARFDSVLQTEGSDAVVLPNGRNGQQEARLGIGRAQLALDRIQEANETLEALVAERPEDADALLWLGKANEAQDPPNYATAEGHYREAIRISPTLFGAYLSLAELFLATERGDDAGVFLERAEAEVPESTEMRYQLGAFELRRNRTDEAIRELDRALELSPDHPPALFSLAVACRRSGQLDRASRTFDRLAEVDSGHPGLSLERGLLFEARGESDRAADAYASALEQNPDDLDLLLRLGAAQVSAGRIDDAEATLDRVRAERPNSSEANHFVGRVAFARGNYAEALGFFRRAVQLDPSRGEFHLYVGWAALETGQLGEALHGVDAAIERDPSLGDAYWIRGVVKLRSGRPRDALVDLERALQLKPSRHEAHAAIGDAQDQLSNLDAAVAAYERAVENVDDNGHWWYRLGRLRMDRGNRAEASTALQRATLLGDAMTPLPGWLAHAHRLRGEALRLGGQARESVRHYRRYLELAPASDIDRRQVRDTLMDMGEVP